MRTGWAVAISAVSVPLPVALHHGMDVLVIFGVDVFLDVLSRLWMIPGRNGDIEAGGSDVPVDHGPSM